MASSSAEPPRVLDAQFVAGATEYSQLPPPQNVEVAFAGRSNVGKSSLMNSLLQRKNLVRTSSTPGCTRQISLFQIKTRRGSELTWVDLPGYGYAKRSHSERDSWGQLIDRYLLERSSLALVVALVDLRRGVEEDDRGLLELLSKPPVAKRPPPEVLLVATKFDKLPSSQRKLAFDKLRKEFPAPWCAFSTELPETHAQLWHQVFARLKLEQPAAVAQAASGERTRSE
jgi:GTP-binding protein